MKTIPFVSNLYENRLIKQYYDIASLAAIFNTAVAVTHKLMDKATICPLERKHHNIKKEWDTIDGTKSFPDPFIKSKRYSIPLRNDYITKLYEIQEKYRMSQTEAVSYCIRTLHKYTAQHSTDILQSYKPDGAGRQTKKSVYISVTLRLPQDTVAYFMANSNEVKYQTVMSEVLMQHARQHE